MITRRQSLQGGLALGLSAAFSPFFASSSLAQSRRLAAAGPLPRKVLIIGAGASGLTAGYLLKRQGVDVTILEATSRFGGRVKRADGFADFPIDLGAEWIHDEPTVLAEIVDDPSVKVEVDTIDYNPQTFRSWVDGELLWRDWLSYQYREYKFKNTTWFGFLERYIAPTILESITFNAPVTGVNYSGENVLVETQDNRLFEADKVVVTVPVAILQKGMIRFTPRLPEKKQRAINGIDMGDGIKVFMEFSERFYPDILLFQNLMDTIFASTDKIFYDAAFGKDSRTNILGLFAVNAEATPYTRMSSDNDIKDAILGELDTIFDGKATRHYMNHVVQNWSKEPFIGGSYSTDFDDSVYGSMSEIFAPLDNRVYFAGEALGEDDQATVHGACSSAFAAVERILVQ